jgi:ferredoxin--NADP+ reductase
VADLTFSETIMQGLPNDKSIGDLVREHLIYYPTVTREPFRNCGRITDLISTDSLTDNIGIPPLSRENDRFMLCGSPSMIVDGRQLLSEHGFAEGNHDEAAHYAIEKAFVER